MTSPATELAAILGNFQGQVNGSRRLERVLNGWSPNIFIEPRGTHESYTLIVNQAQIASVESGRHQADHFVHLVADYDVMTQVFSGQLNPSGAVLDGILVVYASDRDQVKLDAISLVLWGA